MGFKQNAEQKIDDWLETTWSVHAASTRSKFLNRWMKLSGTDNPNEIDYENPIIHLEWALCDPRMLAKLTGNRREEALAMMDEQQR